MFYLTLAIHWMMMLMSSVASIKFSHTSAEGMILWNLDWIFKRNMTIEKCILEKVERLFQET